MSLWFAPPRPRAIKRQRRYKWRPFPRPCVARTYGLQQRPVQARPRPSCCHFCRRLAGLVRLAAPRDTRYLSMACCWYPPVSWRCKSPRRSPFSGPICLRPPGPSSRWVAFQPAPKKDVRDRHRLPSLQEPAAPHRHDRDRGHHQEDSQSHGTAHLCAQTLARTTATLAIWWRGRRLAELTGRRQGRDGVDCPACSRKPPSGPRNPVKRAAPTRSRPR